MIIFHASHLLGNQIFQYCFINTISKKNEKIFLIGMDHVTKNFKVKNKNIYFIGLNTLFKIIIKIFFPILKFLSALRLLHFYKEIYNKDGIPKNDIYYRSGIFPVKYVETGFFQNTNLIDLNFINQLEIKSEIRNKANELISNIPRGYEPVFVHIRRGDYLSEYFQDIRGINLPLTYYYDGIKEIEKNKLNNFFIFLSDDIKFVEENFHNIKDKYISKNSYIVDFTLISLCNYGIVSNSTFSWTASSFIKNKKKIIFPEYWLGWKKSINSHPHIYPSWANIISINKNK